MRRTRMITALLSTLVLLLVGLSISQAQDNNEFLGLSESDYELLRAGIDNTDAAASFQLTYSASLLIDDPATGEQTVDVAGSGAIIHDESPALAITSSGTSSNLGNLPASFSREVRLLDGIGYNNLIDLTSGVDGSWQSQAVDAPFSSAYNLALLLVDPSALESLDLMDIVNLAGGLSELDLQPYITVTREANVTDKGKTLAHFVAVLDTEAVFESPEFTRKLVELLTAAGEDPGIPDEQMAAAGILIGRMFRGSSVAVDLFVDEAEYLTQVSADVTLAVDASILTGEGSPISLSLSLDFSLSGFDGEYTVEAPDSVAMVDGSATPVPASDSITAGNPLVIDLSGSVELLYSATAPETVTITARSLDGRLDTTLDVFDASGNRLGTNDDATVAMPSLGLTDSAIPDLALPGEGVYTIRVGTFSGLGSGQVEVLVRSNAATPVVSTLPGKALFETEPLKVYLTGQEPVDLFYEVVSRETISLYATNLDVNPIPVDSTLEILNADGEQVAFNDDLNSSNPGIENLVLDAGVYTIRLNGYDETEVGGVLVELVTGEPSSEGDTGGNTVEEPEVIGFGETLSGEIADTDTREYRFSGRAGQVITITAEAIEPDSFEQDLYLTLYAPDGNEVAADDDSGDTLGLGLFDPAIIGFTLPDSGEYRIVVDSIFDISGEYQITLQEA